MIDRHKVWTLHNTGEYSQRRIAKTLGIPRTTVQRILAEARVTVGDIEHELTARKARGVGRPSTGDRLVPLFTQWIETEPTLSGREALRRVREQGTQLGDSTFYRAWAQARGKADLREPVMVRFEGVAAEFAQFDFGECVVRLVSGKQLKVHFACYRGLRGYGRTALPIRGGLRSQAWPARRQKEISW